ncbi:hypothetical protein D3C76_1220750 [compost metagenome]
MKKKSPALAPNFPSSAKRAAFSPSASPSRSNARVWADSARPAPDVLAATPRAGGNVIHPPALSLMRGEKVHVPRSRAFESTEPPPRSRWMLPFREPVRLLVGAPRAIPTFGQREKDHFPVRPIPRWRCSRPAFPKRSPIAASRRRPLLAVSAI